MIKIYIMINQTRFISTLSMTKIFTWHFWNSVKSCQKGFLPLKYFKLYLFCVYRWFNDKRVILTKWIPVQKGQRWLEGTSRLCTTTMGRTGKTHWHHQPESSRAKSVSVCERGLRHWPVCPLSASSPLWPWTGEGVWWDRVVLHHLSARMGPAQPAPSFSPATGCSLWSQRKKMTEGTLR